MRVTMAGTNGPKETGEPDLATDLRVATMRLARRLRRELVSSCTESQYGVLAALVHIGPMAPGELADHQHVQAPSMTRTVAAMEDAGLVRRAKHPTDGRQVVVSVTSAGREVVGETKRRRNAWLNQGLERLSSDQRAVLAEAAAIMQGMVDE